MSIATLPSPISSRQHEGKKVAERHPVAAAFFLRNRETPVRGDAGRGSEVLKTTQ
jgi:hypothetical protein